MAKATHLPKYSRISPIKYTKQLGLLPLFLCAGWRRSSTAGQFCVLANSASSMLQHVSNELKASLIQTIKSCFYASGKKHQRLKRNILASEYEIETWNLKLPLLSAFSEIIRTLHLKPSFFLSRSVASAPPSETPVFHTKSPDMALGALWCCRNISPQKPKIHGKTQGTQIRCSSKFPTYV